MIRAVVSPSSPLTTFYETVRLLELRRERYPRPEHAERLAMTDEQYRQVIRRLDEFAGRTVTLGDLTDEFVADYQLWRAQRVKLPTVNKDLRYLQALCRSAVQRGTIAEVPEVRPYEEDEEEAEAYTVEQFADLVSAALRTTGTIGEIPAAAWWFSLLLTLWDTGVRVRACLSTEWSRFNPAERTIRFPAAVQKQKKGQIKVLHPETAAAIEEIRSPERTRIWHWPWHRTTFYKHLREIVGRAGVPLFAKPIHAIRASHATYVCDAADAATASRSLGHSTQRLTDKHYIVQRMLTRVPQIIDLLPRPKYQRPEEFRQRLLF